MIASSQGYRPTATSSPDWLTAEDLRRMGREVGPWIVVVAGATAALFGGPLVPGDPGTLPLLIAMVLFVFAHGAPRYGWAGAATFVAAAFVITSIGESVFARTGIRSGHYSWVHHGAPVLSEGRYAIGLFYAAMGYLAWNVASVLLDRADARLRSNRFDAVALPLVASFVMSTWDLVLDPLNPTRGAVWTWLNGGANSRIPLGSFAGWQLTVYLFFQAFALYLRWRRRPLETDEAAAVSWQPVCFYVVIALSYVPTFLAATGGGRLGDAGASLDRRALYETAMVISLFTMWFAAALAVIKLARPGGHRLPDRSQPLGWQALE